MNPPRTAERNPVSSATPGSPITSPASGSVGVSRSLLPPRSASRVSPALTPRVTPTGAAAAAPVGTGAAGATKTTLTPDQLDVVRRLVHERAAIVLDANKAYLVESRLAPIARREGLPDVGSLIAKIARPEGARLHTEVVEAMTTNETSFYRDASPFEALRTDILPELIRRRAAERSLTIWSAACSTGQEAYSTAMLLKEHFPQLASWNVRILGTDIAQSVLDKASEARYSQLEANRGMPAPMLVKWFDRQGAHWKLKDEVRRMVQFRPLNLAGPWPSIPPVDIVFLRNVMIYFDLDTRRSILARMRKVMRPDGYLFLGNAETTLNLDNEYVPARIGKATCYQIGNATNAQEKR